MSLMILVAYTNQTTIVHQNEAARQKVAESTRYVARAIATTVFALPPTKLNIVAAEIAGIQITDVSIFKSVLCWSI